MALPRLTKGAAQAIDRAVDEAFDALKLRFLGPSATGDKRLFIGFLRERSLPGLFEEAVREEGGVPDLGLLDHLIAVTADYIEQHRAAAKATLKRRVQETLHNVKTGKTTEDVVTVLDAELQKVWNAITVGVRKVVETEAEHAKTLGVKDAIDQINGRLGIEDPIICFIPVRDHALCEECIRLHLFKDSTGVYVPRVWKTSEVKAEFHHKGDPTPSWSKLHPHCRCELTTVLPGFGFDARGHLTWKGEGHDEWARQRGLEERYLKRYGKLRKSTTEGLKLFQQLLEAYPDSYHNVESEPWMNAIEDGDSRRARDRARDYWRNRMNQYVHENWDQEMQTAWYDAAGKLDTNNDWAPAEKFLRKVFPNYEAWYHGKEPHPKFVEAIKSAPITINFPSRHLEELLKNGRYKNLHETGEGMGETDQDVRSDFEDSVLGIAKGVPATERPVYGALNIHSAWSRAHEHEGGAPTYGDAWLELKPHVKDRASFTHDDSFSCGPGHVHTMKHPEALAWNAAHRGNPLWELHHAHGTHDDREHGYIEAQIHGGVYMKNDVAAIHLGPRNGNRHDFTPERLATDKPYDRYQHQTHRSAVELGKKYGIPVFLHMTVRKWHDGPRAEYKTVTLYHPAFDTTKPRKPRKQAIPKEQMSLIKSTPAGLAILRELHSKYVENEKKYEKALLQVHPEAKRMYWHAPIAINVPSYILPHALTNGFKNLHETKEGLGSNNISERTRHEAEVLGVPYTAGAHERPIYGALHVWHGNDPTHELEAHGPANQYGDAFVVLKPHVAERATLTPHDSFGTSPGHVFPANTGRHALMSAVTRLGYSLHVTGDSLDKVREAAMSGKSHGMSAWDCPYHEAQIHGGVYPKDIEGIYLTPKANKYYVENVVQAAKRHRIPVYHYKKAVNTDDSKVPNSMAKVTLYHPDDAPGVESDSRLDSLRARGLVKHETGAYGLPLFKAANWKLKDFERLIGEFGWYPAGNGGSHKLYAHPTIPFKLAVKHEHAHGDLTPYWVKKYAKDIGLNIGYTGQAMQADPKHAYAENYRRMGHLPEDTSTAPAVKTYEPASEHHEVVDINSLRTTRPANQPWKVLKYQASMGRNMKLHPITVSKMPDGGYTVLKGHHLLTAAKAAGLTHVPIRHG